MKKTISLACVLLACLASGTGNAALSAPEFAKLCAKGSPGEIEEAIRSGADIFLPEKGRNALHIAAGFNRNPDVVTVLLRHGADVRSKNQWGSTALMEAVGLGGNSEAALRLVEAGSDVDRTDEYGNNLLLKAIWYRMGPQVVLGMIRRGADVNAISERGTTPLMEAAGGPEPEIVSALLAAGADADVTDPGGRKAIDYAERNPGLRDTEAYRQLLAATGGEQTPSAALDTKTFFSLCGMGIPREIEAAIRKGAEVNVRGKRRKTALMYAAGNGENPGAVLTLIRRVADVNARDGDRWPVLKWASFLNANPEATALLLAFGANVDGRDAKGKTALIEAARAGNAAILDMLLAAGANAGIRDLEGKKAIDYAGENESLRETEAYRRLSEADEGRKAPGSEDFGRKLAFLRLCAAGTPEEVKRAIRDGADPNTDCGGMTALLVAAMRGDSPEIVAALTRGGAKADAKTSRNSTVLLEALKNDANREVVQALIDAGADAGASGILQIMDGRTPALHYALEKIPDREIGLALIRSGVDVDLQDERRRTPLISAALGGGDPEVVSELIRRGADVNARDMWGFSALTEAMENGAPRETVTMLLDAGAKPGARGRDRRTPLMLAARRDDVELVGRLLDMGAYAGERDGFGKSAAAYVPKDGKLAATALYVRLEEAAATHDVEAENNWIHFIESRFSEGDGTPGNPYRIRNARELARMAHCVNEGLADAGGVQFGSRHYRLVADIDLGRHEWTPIGYRSHYRPSREVEPFRGRFDGSGFRISGLRIRAGAAPVGLFGCVAGGEDGEPAVLTDVALVSVDVAGQGVNTGGLVGLLVSADVKNCSIVGGRVSLAGGIWRGLGGLVGVSDGTLENCAADVRVATDNEGASNGDVAAGGLAGINKGRISRSTSSGDVFASAGGDALDACLAGGLVGRNSGTVENSFAGGNVRAGRKTSGGKLAGANEGTVIDSAGTGRVRTSFDDFVHNLTDVLSGNPALPAALLVLAAVFLWLLRRRAGNMKKKSG